MKDVLTYMQRCACLGFFGNNGTENVHKVFSSFGKLGWFIFFIPCWIGVLANPYYKMCAYPRCQQLFAAVAVIQDEVEGFWIVGGIRRRQWQAGAGGWCIILYINGRKSPRWHVGGLNRAANIDGSDLPLLTRPFLILVPNQVYLGLCLDFMRPFKSMSQRDMSFAHTPLCPDNARHCFNFFQAVVLD